MMKIIRPENIRFTEVALEQINAIETNEELNKFIEGINDSIQFISNSKDNESNEKIETLTKDDEAEYYFLNLDDNDNIVYKKDNEGIITILSALSTFSSPIEHGKHEKDEQQEKIKLYSSALTLASFNLKKECYKNTVTYSQKVCTSPMFFFKQKPI